MWPEATPDVPPFMWPEATPDVPPLHVAGSHHSRGREPQQMRHFMWPRATPYAPLHVAESHYTCGRNQWLTPRFPLVVR